MKIEYDLVVEGKIVKTASRIIYLKTDFYKAKEKTEDVHIIRKSDQKEVNFNGREKKHKKIHS